MNPCLRILMTTAMRHAGLPPRDPFQPGGLVRPGKPGLMDDLFQRAGFRAVATTRMDCPFRLPATADYPSFIQDSAGPILQMLAPLDAEARAAAWWTLRHSLRSSRLRKAGSGRTRCVSQSDKSDGRAAATVARPEPARPWDKIRGGTKEDPSGEVPDRRSRNEDPIPCSCCRRRTRRQRARQGP